MPKQYKKYMVIVKDYNGNMSIYNDEYYDRKVDAEAIVKEIEREHPDCTCDILTLTKNVAQ